MGKVQQQIWLTDEEKRAIGTLASLRGLTKSTWTREQIKNEWNERYPGMEYPDENGNILPKKDGE